MRFLLVLLLLGASDVAFAGYDLHITRRAEWADTGPPRISYAEWLRYVKTDRQVVLDSQDDKNFFVVTVQGQRYPLLFDPPRGELYTKDPTPPLIEKLEVIAVALHARVQGDDGEFYTPKP